jgi:hypothetical protein
VGSEPEAVAELTPRRPSSASRGQIECLRARRRQTDDFNANHILQDDDGGLEKVRAVVDNHNPEILHRDSIRGSQLIDTTDEKATSGEMTRARPKFNVGGRSETVFTDIPPSRRGEYLS